MKNLRKFKSWGEWAEDRRNVQYSPTVAYIEKEDQVVISEGKLGREAYYGATADNMYAINDKSNLEWLIIDGEYVDISTPVVQKQKQYDSSSFIDIESETINIPEEYRISLDTDTLTFESPNISGMSWDVWLSLSTEDLQKVTGEESEEDSDEIKTLRAKWISELSVIENFMLYFMVNNLAFGGMPLIMCEPRYYDLAYKLGSVDEEFVLYKQMFGKFGIVWEEGFVKINNVNSLLSYASSGLGILPDYLMLADANGPILSFNTEVYSEGKTIKFQSEGNHIVNFELIDKTYVDNMFNSTCIVSLSESALSKITKVGSMGICCPYLRSITFPTSLKYIDSYSIVGLSLNHISFLGTICPEVGIECIPDMGQSGTLMYPKNANYDKLIEQIEPRNWINRYVSMHMYGYVDITTSVGLLDTTPYKMWVDGTEVTPSSSYTFTEIGWHLIDLVLESPYSIQTYSDYWTVWFDEKFYGYLNLNDSVLYCSKEDFRFYFNRLSSGSIHTFDVKVTLGTYSSTVSLFGANFDKTQIQDVNCIGGTYSDGTITLNEGVSKVTAFISISSLLNACEMFNRSAIQSIDLRSLDTGLCTNMSYMFNACGASTLDLSNFNTSNVTDMSNMFAYANCFEISGLESFDTSKVTNMSGMFTGVGVSSLDLSNFDTSNVTDMSYMFLYDGNLEKLDVSSFNTSNVTNMSGMFAYCFKLNYLDLFNFDTSNVTDMSVMFAYCDNLQTIDLSTFSFKNCEKLKDMFYNQFDANISTTYLTTCDKLKKIYINWDKEGELNPDDSNMFTENYKNVLLIYNGKYSVSNLESLVPYNWILIPQVW